MTTPQTRCTDCHRLLTPEEKHYYAYRCHECERAELERYQAWMQGGEDKELDELYGGAQE